MLRLPPLDVGKKTWRLLLASRHATALANALLLEDSAEGPARLAGLLADSPPLLLWCLGQALNRGVRLGSLEETSVWLARNAIAALQWTADEAAAVGSHSDLLDNTAACSVARLLPLLAEQCATELDDSIRPAAAQGGRDSHLWFVDFVQRPQRLDAGEPTKENGPSPATDTRATDASAARAPQIDFPQLMRRLARLAELQTSFAIRLEREKLAALKELAYGASHEINNPLANISTRAQTLLRDETDPERRRKLATINSQALRAHEMIADLMLFAKPPQLQQTRQDLVTLVQSVLAEIAPAAEGQGTTLCWPGHGEAVLAQVDDDQIAVAVKAICLNALQALGAGGQIQVTVQALPSSATDRTGSDAVEIIVQDTGPGIAPEIRRHLFDPFFSGREAGRGLGFGLAKAWRIISQHGGQIDVESELNCGARFTIRLPAAAPDRAPSPAVNSESGVP